MTNNVVALKSGGAISPIIPSTIEEVFRLAGAIAKSGLAPRGMDTPEKLTIAIMHGLEIGLPPLQAVQRIAVVNGRPTIWGDALPALLWARGFKIGEAIAGAGDSRTARCVITRPDKTEIGRSFSVADAKRAGLWGKAGPWTQYPDRMLAMRARGFAARDGAADALSGLYLAEEIIDAGMRDVTPERPAPLDIPDIPDAIDQTQPAETVTQEPDTITDVEGYLSKLESDRSLCESDEELKELADGNADLIARLPAHGRKRAAEILKAE